MAAGMSFPRATNRRVGRPGLGNYGTLPAGQQLHWNGPTNKYGNPTIKGVSSLDAARIKQDSTMGSLGGKKSSQQIAEEETDRQSANKVKRSVAFEQGYENYRRTVGMGAPTGTTLPVATAPAKPADPNEARRKNFVAGGLSPREANTATQQTAAKPAVANGPSIPVPASPLGAVGAAAANAQKTMNPGATSNDPALAARLQRTGATNAITHATPIAPPAAPVSPLMAKANDLGNQAAAMKKQRASISEGLDVASATADEAIERGQSSAEMTGKAADALNKPIASVSNALGKAKTAMRDPAGSPEQIAKLKTASDAQNTTITATSGKVPASTMTGRLMDPAVVAAESKSNAAIQDLTKPTAAPEVPQVAATAEKKEPTARAGGGTVKKAEVRDALTGEVTQPAGEITAMDRAKNKMAGKFMPPVVPGTQTKTLAYNEVGNIRNAEEIKQRPLWAAARNKKAVEALKKGGKAQASHVYRVGEKGTAQKPKPELFMPKSGKPPSVIGAHGPQTGTFPEDGVVIPHPALKKMAAHFSKEAPDAKLAKAKTAMRPR